MADDESFLRAILEAPSDDAPRLIYADWLDERGDPRGEYLRAEVRFREAFPFAHPDAVRESRQRVNSLWIARVSRPPLGVCCDRIAFKEHEPSLHRPSLTVPAVDAVESRFGVTLPDDYRAFLLNYNGGVPKPDTFITPDGIRYALIHFHTIWSQDGTALYDEDDFVARLQLREEDVLWQQWPFRDMIDIARVEIGRHEILCLGWRGDSAGKVFLIDLWMEDPEPVIEVAQSLADFFELFDTSGTDA